MTDLDLLAKQLAQIVTVTPHRRIGEPPSYSTVVQGGDADLHRFWDLVRRIVQIGTDIE